MSYELSNYLQLKYFAFYMLHFTIYILYLAHFAAAKLPRKFESLVWVRKIRRYNRTYL